MRRALFILAASLFCWSGGQVYAADNIRLGALSELTGPGAMNGEQCLRGYKIAEKLFRKVNPHIEKRVEVIYGDHRREQKTAIAEFHRLAQAEVWAVAANHGIIGVAINPLSKTLRIPLFGVMGHESFVLDNDLAFRIIPTPQQEGGGLAEKAYTLGARRAAVLVLEDDYILAVGNSFRRRFSELGGAIAYYDSFSESDSDFAAIAARIRSANPDVLSMTLGFQQFGPAIRRLREQGVRQKLYSNFWLSYPAVIDAAGKENVETSVFITERSDYPAFLRAYEEEAGAQFRSGVVFRCYTALSVPLAIIGLSAPKDKEQFIQKLGGLQSVVLPDREVLFKGREVQFDMEFFKLADGHPAPLH